MQFQNSVLHFFADVQTENYDGFKASVPHMGYILKQMLTFICLILTDAKYLKISDGALLKAHLFITPVFPGKVQHAPVPQTDYSSRDQNCKNVEFFGLSSTALSLLSMQTLVATSHDEVLSSNFVPLLSSKIHIIKIPDIDSFSG